MAAQPAAAKGNDLMSVDVTNLRRVVGASASVIAILQGATAVLAVRRVGVTTPTESGAPASPASR
jgi:hypothetical protein